MVFSVLLDSESPSNVVCMSEPLHMEEESEEVEGEGRVGTTSIDRTDGWVTGIGGEDAHSGGVGRL